jgi:hypothetical protein
MIHAEQQTLDLEQDDRVETIVVGLRYTGNRSTVAPRRPRDAGGWPGRGTFQAGPVTEVNDEGRIVEREDGPIQIGVIPDWIDGDTVEGGTLPGLEQLSDFEVIYDPAELCAAILEENYLPPSVFGGPQTAPDYAVREAVFDALDLPDKLGTAPGGEKAIREALAERAGMDVELEEPPDVSRETEYTNEYTRSDLYNACDALGVDVEWSDARKTEMAKDLATYPPGDVRDALNGEYDDGSDE